MFQFHSVSPKKIDRNVAALLDYLGLDQHRAVHLKFSKITQFVSEPDNCHLNVWRHIKAAGGAPQHGWVVAQDKTKSFVEGIFHTVWKAPDGRLMDVTPRKDLEKRLLFVPDFERRIVLTQYDSQPALHTFDNVRMLQDALWTPLTEITTVMQDGFAQRSGLWPW
jgi:hypothetical protein